MGRLTSPTVEWRPLPFAFLCMCSLEVLLDLENGLFISYLGSTQLLLPPAVVFMLEYLSTAGKLQLLTLGPLYLLPHLHLVVLPPALSPLYCTPAGYSSSTSESSLLIGVSLLSTGGLPFSSQIATTFELHCSSSIWLSPMWGNTCSLRSNQTPHGRNRP